MRKLQAEAELSDVLQAVSRLAETRTQGGTESMESITYNADCLAAMREMPDNAFDLAVVDPPYGDANGGDGSARFGGMFASSIAGENTRKHTHRGADSAIPDRALKSTGVTRTGGTWAAKYGKKS